MICHERESRSIIDTDTVPRRRTVSLHKAASRYLVPKRLLFATRVPPESLLAKRLYHTTQLSRARTEHTTRSLWAEGSQADTSSGENTSLSLAHAATRTYTGSSS